MRVLVLGGTWFLGRALVTEALRRGHEVTTFNRGRSGPDALGAEAVHGDRENPGDLRKLLAGGRSWEAVIDTSGQVPRVVLGTARALAGSTGQYVFISTVSVYQGRPVQPLTEDSPVLDCPADAGPDYGENHPRGYPRRYGFQKAGCERAVSEYFGGRALILRPGVILGPHEYIGRLPWWLRRMERGGRVLAPGDPAKLIQPADVRDVAAFALTGAQDALTGTFNVAPPNGHATYGSLMENCIKVTASHAELVWVDEDFLVRNDVRQWTEIPLWRIYDGTWNVSASRARAAGLSCRPLPETVRDTWMWLTTGGPVVRHDRKTHIGLSPGKERDLLTAWAAVA